ncbi:hypothetical protein SSAG_05103 [Streptomyces sp. Mg1]|nr:hypothetical protein SSAG_05103 [Streptomyces sp. Mg1]
MRSSGSSPTKTQLSAGTPALATAPSKIPRSVLGPQCSRAASVNCPAKAASSAARARSRAVSPAPGLEMMPLRTPARAVSTSTTRGRGRKVREPSSSKLTSASVAPMSKKSTDISGLPRDHRLNRVEPHRTMSNRVPGPSDPLKGCGTSILAPGGTGRIRSFRRWGASVLFPGGS